MSRDFEIWVALTFIQFSDVQFQYRPAVRPNTAEDIFNKVNVGATETAAVSAVDGRSVQKFHFRLVLVSAGMGSFDCVGSFASE